MNQNDIAYTKSIYSLLDATYFNTSYLINEAPLRTVLYFNITITISGEVEHMEPSRWRCSLRKCALEAYVEIGASTSVLHGNSTST